MERRLSEERIVQILRAGEAAETEGDVRRKHGISEWTYYLWRRRYGGLAESRAKRLVAEQALAAEALEERLGQKGLRSPSGGTW